MFRGKKEKQIWGFRLPVLEFGGKKEKQICFVWVVQLLRDHNQFIADIESRLGFLLR